MLPSNGSSDFFQHSSSVNSCVNDISSGGVLVIRQWMIERYSPQKVHGPSFLNIAGFHNLHRSQYVFYTLQYFLFRFCFVGLFCQTNAISYQGKRKKEGLFCNETHDNPKLEANASIENCPYRTPSPPAGKLIKHRCNFPIFVLLYIHLANSKNITSIKISFQSV